MDKKLLLELNLGLLQYAEAISGELGKLIRPLFQNLPFSHFSYVKVFENGQYLMWSNDLRIVQSFLDYRVSRDSQYFLSSKNLNIPLNSSFKWIWPLDDKRLPGLFAYHKLNVSHGINISYHLEDYVETFIFGAPIECEQVTDIYLNHYYILERFIVYFKAELVKLNAINKGLLASSYFYKREFPKLSQIKQKFLTQNFFQDTKVDKFYLEKCPQTHLTKKETECLYYLCLGKSAKQISSILNTSRRTIEKHFENIKVKCNLNFSDQIVNLCYESGIDKLHLEKF